MNLVIIVCLFLLGIVLIVKGGDFFVDAASWIAQVSGVPKLIIGATIVSLATTMPEMLVSLMASLQEKVDMSIGNAVGSVTANIGLPDLHAGCHTKKRLSPKIRLNDGGCPDHRYRRL